MKTHRPPRWAERLFKWYCGVAKVDDLHGDIEELFYQNLKRKSLWAARLIYRRHVLSLMSSYALTKRKRDSRFHPLSSSNNLSLMENYFKVAFRNIVKQKYFATINIVGLAIGMSVSLLLIALLNYTASYDKFHERRKDIYRVTTTRDDKVSNRQYASAPLPLVDKLGAEFSGIEKMVRLKKGFQDLAVSSGGSVPLSGYYTDPAFLQVFTFPLVSGNPRTALGQPRNIVLTAGAAMKLFNSTDVLGKVIQFERGGNFEVTGIVGDPPKNSHLQFEALVSYASRPVPEAKQKVDEEWANFRDNYLYLIVPLPAVGRLQEYLNNISMEIPGDNASVHLGFELQALRDIVPGPDMFNQIGPDWDYTSFAIFGTLCLCILLPACFNYANISIARALKRSKEIGLRKTLGSLRQQIFFQFITETVIITLLALVGGILIFLVIRSEFHSMLVSASVLDLSLTPATILYFFVFAVATGFLAGVMPAIYFSKINPMEALKNQHALKVFSGKRIRTALIVLQFAMSLTFIMSIVVISKQYRYALNFDLGFNQENILDVELRGTDPEVFRSEFSRLSSVQSISMSSGVLGTSYPQTWIKEPGRMDSSEVFQMFVDERYLSNVGLKLLTGRNFGQSPRSGERHIIVNEEFLNICQITSPGAALGQSFVIDSLELEIVGVVKNFHFMNLKQPVRAFLFRSRPDQYKLANVRIQSNDLEQTFSAMEAAWKALGNGHKMEARFFEDEIEEAYISYKVMLKIFGFLGLLAISISCLGLLGMVVYTAETKTKEVSIRKIMGATTLNLALLLSSGYLKLMLVGAAFAIPITWLAFDKFFSVMSYYRVAITILDVAFSVLIMLALGLGTMAWQTMKTATANPADTLKYE